MNYRRLHGGPGSGTSQKRCAVSHRAKFAKASKACALKKKSGTFKGALWYCIGKELKGKRSCGTK